MAKEHFLGLRIDEPTKTALQIRAAREQRSVGQVVRRIIAAAIGHD